MRSPDEGKTPRAKVLVNALAGVGVALTLLVFLLARREVDRDFARSFELESENQTAHIASYLGARLIFLDDLARHLELGAEPSPEAFRAFVATERARVEGIQALEWAPLVTQGQRRQREARLRQWFPGSVGLVEKGPDGRLHAAGSRPIYFPVSFLEPLKGNESALGFDLGSNPLRLKAIETARDSGLPAATEPLTLVQETRSQAGFLIFVPVYSRMAFQGDLEHRRQAFKGVVLVVFRTQDLLAAALAEPQRQGLRGSFRDLGTGTQAKPFHAWGTGSLGEPQPIPLLSRLLLAKVPVTRTPMAVAGRTWEISLEPGPAFIESHLQKSHWLVIPMGLMLTGLLTFLFHLVHRQKRRAERLVEARTQALEESLARLGSREYDLRLLLDSTAEAIYGLDLQGCCTFCNQALLRMLGYTSPEELIGRNMHDLIHHTKADGQPFPVVECRLFQAFREGVETHADDEVVWRADGTSLPVEYWSFPQRKEGQVVGAVVTFIEISQRLRAEVEARRQQSMVQNLLDSIPDLIFFKDLDGIYHGCNPPFSAFVGKPREAIIGATDFDLFGPTVATFFQEQDRLMLAEGTPRHNDEWVRYPNGHRALLDTLKTPLRGPTGELVGLLGISRDITSRKLAEQGLLEKDQLLDALNWALVGLLDATDWQGALEDFLSLLGKGAKASRTYIYRFLSSEPTDQDVYLSLTHEWCSEGVGPQLGNADRQRIPMLKVGFGRWVEELVNGQMIAGDISTFPETEQLYLASVGVQTLLVMPIFVDGQLWGLVGFDECFNGRTWSRSEVDILRLSARALGIVIERQNSHSELEAARAELEERVGHRTRELLQANLDLKEEMSTRHRAEERNQLAQMQLHQAQKLESVGRLAAGIAHEINTPIQFLSMNLRFLQRTYTQIQAVMAQVPRESLLLDDSVDLAWIEEETPKVLLDSMEGIDRVAKIVRAMKEFSHPGSPDPVAVDLNRCLESAATVSRNEWKYSAELVLDLDTELPLIQGFPAELNQVFLNLVVNAGHAIAAKERESGNLGSIRISTAKITTGVEIRIQDTGTGIALEHQAKVFDPFFTTKDVGIGTGQGLTVCYQTVVHMHGGRISFESVPGEGTTFVVQLPLQAAPAKGWGPKEGVA